MSVTPDDLRQVALKQLQERRDFMPHLLAYILVNAGLVLVWALVSHGIFWPGFVLLFGAAAWSSTPGPPSCASRSPRPRWSVTWPGSTAETSAPLPARIRGGQIIRRSIAQRVSS